MKNIRLNKTKLLLSDCIVNSPLLTMKAKENLHSAASIPFGLLPAMILY